MTAGLVEKGTIRTRITTYLLAGLTQIRTEQYRLRFVHTIWNFVAQTQTYFSIFNFREKHRIFEHFLFCTKLQDDIFWLHLVLGFLRVLQDDHFCPHSASQNATRHARRGKPACPRKGSRASSSVTSSWVEYIYTQLVSSFRVCRRVKAKSGAVFSLLLQWWTGVCAELLAKIFPTRDPDYSWDGPASPLGWFRVGPDHQDHRVPQPSAVSPTKMFRFLQILFQSSLPKYSGPRTGILSFFLVLDPMQQGNSVTPPQMSLAFPQRRNHSVPDHWRSNDASLTSGSIPDLNFNAVTLRKTHRLQITLVSSVDIQRAPRPAPPTSNDEKFDLSALKVPSSLESPGNSNEVTVHIVAWDMQDLSERVKPASLNTNRTAWVAVFPAAFPPAVPHPALRSILTFCFIHFQVIEDHIMFHG